MNNNLVFSYNYNLEIPMYTSLLDKFMIKEVKLTMSKEQLENFKKEYLQELSKDYHVNIVEKKFFRMSNKYLISFHKKDKIKSAKFDKNIVRNNIEVTQ